MMTDQSLPDAVIALQHLDLAPESRQLVEDAARLLSEGRQEEARSLLDQVEAWGTLPQAASGTPDNGNGTAKTNGSSNPALLGIIAPLAEKLAAGFTGVLTSVLEDLHHYAGDRIQAVARSLEDQIQDMQTSLRQVSDTGTHLEQLGREQQAGLQALQQGHEELWNTVRALQEADREQRASLEQAAAATGELSQQLSNQVDAVASRFEELEKRISVVDWLVHEMQPQLSGLVAQIEEHTATLRTLEQRQQRRVSTLNQMLDSLSKLREPEAPEVALSAQA